MNDAALTDNCRNEDGDDYYFWGLGPKPQHCNCDTIEDCDDNDPFIGGYDENYRCRCNLEFNSVSHHINSDTTWSDTNYVNFEVVIDSGACLTISGYTAFVPKAGIQVEQGGKLILDSAYLTKICPELWQGIDVLGSDTIQDYDEYFGKVVVRNNSIIEFAEVGIANHCRTCGYQDMQCGGMISAEISIFRNNKRDILLNPFSTYWFGHDLPYACTIENCQFITTDLIYPEYIPVAHIEMKSINGVMLYGCTFINESTPLNSFNTRGIGISSIDSYFMLNKYCNTIIIPCNDWSQCEFSSLDYGIKALNSKTKRTLEIKDVNFTSNYIGVSLSGIDNAAVISNIFTNKKMPQDEIRDRFIGGIFLEGCTGYHIEANEFSPSLFSRPGISFGIGIKNSGTDNNEIYNNIFMDLQIGIVSIGSNRGRESGLCLKCNDMRSNSNDFAVFDVNGPPLGTYQGINRYQGNPVDSTSFDAPAGNTFTLFADDSVANPLQLRNYNYFNHGEDLWYFHHQRQIYPLTYPLDSNYTRETIELKERSLLDYEKERACPSGLGGGGNHKSYSTPMSIINEADIELDKLRTQLNALVDAGNTEALNFDVMTSLPDEGLEIRQELLSTSPYLSDTVLKQAIYKEDVLPNAMIRDVLEANPQSAKSDEILNTLESRYEPMPDYMMDQIMEGKKYLGAKEILETKIQSWQQIRSKAKADLMREFLLDTSMISPLDSVIAFLENETDLESRYDLALAQWNNSDPAGSLTTLNNIPLLFILNENQDVILENYLAYFGILQTISDSNWQTNQMDSVSVSMLFYLKESGNPMLNALARGLLVSGEFFKYFETITFPDISKSSNILPDQHKEISTINKEEKLWLFPNPAGDYIIAYYDLDPKYKSGEIQVIDLKGNLLKSYFIRSGKDQMVIDLKDYPGGLYLISLHSRNQVIDSNKISKGGY